jgi:prepilin-type N-terminal cleavage/methylation domain-containing protein
MKISAKNKTGFTLIELLIVIALLGALAIGLLATIDPFEQLKKGRDTATRNTVTEFYNANLRYYGTKGEFPWGSALTTISSQAFTGANIVAAIGSLTTFGELKNNFTVAAGMNRLGRMFVTSTAPDDVAVCFQPESKNFRLDPNTVFDVAGATMGSGACAGNGATVLSGNAMSCYWCIH